MKKFFYAALLSLAAASFSSSHIHAQSSSSFLYVHAIAGVPTDESTKHKYSSDFGAEAGYGIGTGTTYFTASLGYLSVSAKDTFKSETYVPLKIGLRQYFTTENTYYLAANAGAGFIGNSYPTPKTANPSSVRFAADVSLGTKLSGFDVALAFDIFKEPKADGTSGFAELRIGWNFDLSN